MRVPAVGEVKAFWACCEAIEFGLTRGFLVLDPINEEVGFPPVSVKEAGGTVGNVLTGEIYDPETHFVGLGVVFCPFCGAKIGRGVR